MASQLNISPQDKNTTARAFNDLINPNKAEFLKGRGIIINLDEEGWACCNNFLHELNKVFQGENIDVDPDLGIDLEELKGLVNHTDSMILSEDFSKIKYIQLTQRQKYNEFYKYRNM